MLDLPYEKLVELAAASLMATRYSGSRCSAKTAWSREAVEHEYLSV
jgi:hypothetical protein